MSSVVSTPEQVARQAQEALAQPRGRTRRERTFQTALFIATAVAVVVLVVLLVDILSDGLLHLRGSLFTSYASRFAERFGYRSGITGTLSLMVLVTLMAFPAGVGA